MSVGCRGQPDATFAGFSEEFEQGRGWSSPRILSHLCRSRPHTVHAINVLLVPSRITGSPAYTLCPREPQELEMVTKMTAPVVCKWFFARCTCRKESPENDANFFSSKWIQPVLEDLDQSLRRKPKRRAAEGGCRCRRWRSFGREFRPGEVTNWMLSRFDQPVWRHKCHQDDGKQTCPIQYWMVWSSSGIKHR